MPDHVSRLAPASTTLTSSATQDPAMRLVFDGPSDGTEIVRTFVGPNPPATAVVRFEPVSPNERLIGQPSSWCNSPSAGQPLVFNVPVPLRAGDPDTEGTLQVRPSSSSIAIVIKVRIKHPS